MAVLREYRDFAKRIANDRVGNAYVYGGNWSSTNPRVGTDCSGLVISICDAVRNGPRMSWSRHGMSTESWRPIEVGQTGTRFNTICVRHPRDFPSDAVVKIALHHGPGGGANSHMWCEIDGQRFESAGGAGCVTGSKARDVYDTGYANDWHYLPGPVTGVGGATVDQQPLSTKDRYALAVISEGQRRGISPRGIQIALATVLVESNLVMYANAKVPDSLRIPHEAVGSDYDSVGLFQQRCPMWGPAATLMNPTLSAGLFYDRLAKLPYNGPGSPGSYAQAVQRSAFPDRYDQRFAEATKIYDRLTSTSTGADDMAAVPQAQWDEVYRQLTARFPSRSIYRTPGEGLIDNAAGMLLNVDAMTHADFIERLARLGDKEAISRIARTAAGLGAVTDARAVGQAQTVLASIPEQYLTAYLNG